MISALLSSDNKEEEEQETTSKGKGFDFFFCFHAKYFQSNLGNISILKKMPSLQESSQLSSWGLPLQKSFKISQIFMVHFGLLPLWLESSSWQVLSCTSFIILLRPTTSTFSPWLPVWYPSINLDLWYIIRISLHNCDHAQNFWRYSLSRWRKTIINQLICIYGYSLTTFLPVTAICFIKSWVIQTVILAVAFFFSTVFLIRGVISLNSNLGQK